MADIVLFDLDGTLTDPWEGITRCVQYGMEAAGHYEPDREKLTPFIGPPLMDMFMGEYGFTFHIDSYFEHIVGSELSGERVRKGDVIKEALRRFGAEGKAGEKGERAMVWMVGDRKHDVIGAGEAGIPCVGVLYGYGGYEELSQAGADRLVSTVGELARLLPAL